MSRGAGREHVIVDAGPIGGTIVTGGEGWIDTTGALKYYINSGEKPRISSTPHEHDIAAGVIPTKEFWGMFGRNDNPDVAIETVWSYSSKYHFPTTAGQLQIKSSSIQDGPLGTGILSVHIEYLKSDYTEGSVDLIMNGATYVATGASHADIFRVNRVYALTTGTSMGAVGNITLSYVVGGAVQAYIEVGQTQARQAFYTCPAGKAVMISSVNVSCSGQKYIIFTFKSNVYPGTATLSGNLLFPYYEVTLLNDSVTHELSMPRRLPPTGDIIIDATSELAGSICTATCHGWIETL